MDNLMHKLANEFREAIKRGDWMGAADATSHAKACGYSLEIQAEGVRWRKVAR